MSTVAFSQWANSNGHIMHMGQARIEITGPAPGASIFSSINISALFDEGNGQWRANFINRFNSANYVPAGSAAFGSAAGADVPDWGLRRDGENPRASLVRFNTCNGTPGFDCTFIDFNAVGDLA